MYLTDEEKRMLQGESGTVPQLCMQYLVEECAVSGAERLVDLDGTGDFHTPMTSMSPFYQFGLEDLKALVESGAHFKIPTFANKVAVSEPHAAARLAKLRYVPPQRPGLPRGGPAGRIHVAVPAHGPDRHPLVCQLSDRHVSADDGTALRMEREFGNPVLQCESRRQNEH